MPMSTIFVGRHPGAVSWMKTKRVPVDRWVDALDIDDVKPGDIVVGTLPVHLIADVCGRGARFVALCLDIPRNLRGAEFTEEEVGLLNGRLEAYEVRPAALPFAIPQA